MTDGHGPLASGRRGRLYDLKELRDNILLPILGVGMMVFGGWVCWLAVTWMRRGYLDSGDGMVYASQEPFWFYFSAIFIAALGLAFVVLGPELIVMAWRERRYSVRLVKRLLRGWRGRR